jgi:hypothetical protein
MLIRVRPPAPARAPPPPSAPPRLTPPVAAPASHARRTIFREASRPYDRDRRKVAWSIAKSLALNFATVGELAILWRVLKAALYLD